MDIELNPPDEAATGRWVVVADGSRARIFEAHRHAPGLRPVLAYDLTVNRLRDHDRWSDRAGQTHQSAGHGVHSMAAQTDPVDHEHELLAREVARVLTHVTPTLAISLGIDAEDLTRDPAALAAYWADPLVTGKATVRWGTESLDTVQRIKDGMSGIDIPLLVVHGEADHLNLVAGAHSLFDAVPNADKTMRVYPGVFHEPHNDLGHEQLATDVTEWLGHLAAEA